MPNYGLSCEHMQIRTDAYTYIRMIGILDAMAIGLPVVVTPGTTFDELVNERQCGWVTKSEPEAIAKTILQIYEERSDLADKSIRARTCVSDLFQWENVAKQTIEKYKDLLEK